MNELSTPLICAAGALAGGIVKGALGMGLPLVAVPMLSMAMPVREAIALLSVPTVSSNFWQTFEGGRFLAVLRRFWALLGALCLGIAFGTRLLVSSDPRTTHAVLGSVVIASALVGQFPPRLMVPRRLECWLGPLVGLFAGVIGGISSFFGPPVVAYLLTLRLPPDEFVSSISLVYFVGTVPLYGGLALQNALGARELALSVLITLPVAAGLAIGRWLRVRIDQRHFRQALIVVLLLIGLNLLRKALGWP